MQRKHMKPAKDHAVFRRTAIGKKAINKVSRLQARGGTRL